MSDVRHTLADIARRTLLMVSRGTLKKAKDDELMQHVDVDLFADETRKAVERFQQYGFTSVPHPEKDEKDQHPAEVLAVTVGGNRAHLVILAIDDRRYRLHGLKNGELALYDDQGQQVHISRDGIIVSAPKGKKIVGQIMSSDKKPDGTVSEGKGFGQAAQAGKEVHSSYTLDQDAFTIDHKTKILFKVGGTSIELTESTIQQIATSKINDKVGGSELELTSGEIDLVSGDVSVAAQTWLGQDGKGAKVGPKVVTVAGPAKKTFAVV